MHRSRSELAQIFYSLAVLLLLAGCAEPTTSSPPIASFEPSWQDQIAEVANGKTDQIVVESVVISDLQLDQLAPLQGLHILKLQKGAITDQGVKSLASLPRLEQLVLRDSALTDLGAATLAAFPALRIVNLPQSQIGDEGIKHLAKIPHLELLRLGSNQPLSTEGLRRLSTAKELRFLHFIGIPLTDESLEPLGEIETLESLYIDGGSFSDEAISNLLKKRPALHMHFDQRHHDSDPKANDHRH